MEELKTYIGQTFVKQRFSSVDYFTLEEVRKKEVKLREKGRKDTFCIPIARFKKFYKPEK